MMICLTIVCCVAFVFASVDNVKHVILYNNGESSDGVEHNVHQTDFDQGLALWYETLNAAQPVKKAHTDPGTATLSAVFNGNGVNVTSFEQIVDGERLYLVAEGLLFIWPFVELGHNATLPLGSMEDGTLDHVILESVSDKPPVFKLHHFMVGSEADALIEAAEAINDPVYKLKRSTTGVHTDPDKVVYAETRTSENAFDTNTPTSMALKRRAFELLRIPQYDETMADGLQLLRYRQKQAYIPHHDWFDDAADWSFNFDPAKGGANRFATVFLYLSDVEEGGQTVFPMTTAPEGISGLERRTEVPEEAKELFKETDWEMDVVRKCYSKLAFKPSKASALLFYSQTGDGQMDEMSLHGACPVLSGTKWGANLWVWNRLRHGLQHTSSGGEAGAYESTKVDATFVNETPDTVDLMWGDSVFATIAPQQTSQFTTYQGHAWSATIDGDVVWRHTIVHADGAAQRIPIKVDDGYKTEL